MEATRTPAPTGVRFRVKIHFKDGTDAELVAVAPLGIQDQNQRFVIVALEHGAHAVLNIDAVKYWEVVGGAIHVAAGLQ